MDVLLWLENLEIVDSVLVQPGHRRQLAERLPDISTRLFSEAKSIGSWRFHLLGHNLHSVSFSSCLPSIQQWLLTTISQWRNYIRKIGTMTATPAGITAGVAWLWLWGRWLRSCLPPQLKNLIVTQHQVWKWDLQTDGTLGSFSCSPQPHIALHGWHHREAQKGPTTQAENLSCRKPGFWWSPWGGWLARASYLVHIPYVRCQYLPHLNGAMDPVVRCLSSPNFCHSYRRFSDPMQLRENEAKPQSSDILKRHWHLKPAETIW